jgi:TM2 domain-containing membrane protein YozV
VTAPQPPYRSQQPQGPYGAGQFPPPYQGPYAPNPYAPWGVDQYGRPLSDKSKVAAGLLSFFLGQFGVGRFYLGYTTFGVLQIVITVCTLLTLGWVWPLIDTILIFTGSLPDAQGRTLRD